MVSESAGMVRLKEWVNTHAFIDLPLSGRQFTLSRGNSRSRIDKVMCQSE